MITILAKVRNSAMVPTPNKKVLTGRRSETSDGPGADTAANRSFCPGVSRTDRSSGLIIAEMPESRGSSLS